MLFRLEPDVKQKLVKLLAIEADQGRGNDNFCSMVDRILKGELLVHVSTVSFMI